MSELVITAKLPQKKILQGLDLVYIPLLETVGIILASEDELYSVQFCGEVKPEIIAAEYGAKCAWYDRDELIYLGSVVNIVRDALNE